MVPWRRERQTTSVFLPWEPHEQYEKAKDMTLKVEPPKLVVSSMLLEKSREIALEGMKRQNQIGNDTQLWMCLVVKVKVQYCKEQYCKGTWNVRFMNQGKLEVIKQEIVRVNINILGISELKWNGRI